MKKHSLFIISLLLAGSSLVLNAQSGSSEYKVVNKFHVPGDGGWDYLSVDESTGRVFISHGTVVDVVDGKTGTLLGMIHDTKGVHGIALAPELNKAFISNGKDSSVTVIDLKLLAFKEKIAVTGQNPDAILYDPFSQKVFVYNGRSANATVIDAKTDKVVATIKLDGKPEFSVTDGKGKVYVNIEDKNEITCIDASSLKVERVWSIAPGEEPSGLAIDNDNHRLFAVCDNNLMVVVDAFSGQVITTLPIGRSTDGAIYDPVMKRVYSSNGDGTMTVVQEINRDKFAVLENVKTLPGARTIALDKKTGHLFLTTAEFGPAPEKTEANQHPRPSILPDTFTLIEIARVK